MKKITLLPIALAVASSLVSAPTLAGDDASEGIVFSGYARYGAALQLGDEKLVNAAGQLNGVATGRLGNEANGGEFQLTKAFNGVNDTIWDVAVMIDHWSNPAWAEEGGVDLKKAYAGVRNIFETQPDLYIWAGRDFHQRPQTGLNDYFWMMHDGQGGGFKNLNLGGAMLDFAAVGQVDGNNGSFVTDNGKYAVTSKLHGIKLGEAVDLSLYANYGMASDQAEGESYEDTTAYQLAGELSVNGHRLVVRYADNAKDSVFDLAEGRSALLASLDGTVGLSEKAAVEYVAAYQTLEEEDNSGDRTNYNVIVRPTYAWDDIHSTWIEGGYNVVDYDNVDATNTAWKLTFSQNLAIGGETWDRPMLRFYATVGDSENEVEDITSDTFTVGAMWEAWW